MLLVNIKYYVLTIISIFIALGIGIIIGFAFDAQEIITSQKKDIIMTLEDKYYYLRNENEKIKEELKTTKVQNENYENFSKKLLSLYMQGKLKGVNISIINTTDRYIYSDLLEVLETLGAHISSIITLKNEKIYSSIELNKEFDNNNILQKILSSTLNGT